MSDSKSHQSVNLQLVTASQKGQHLDLYLTMQLGEKSESLLQGRVVYGLKGGKLRLELQQAKLTIIPNMSSPPLQFLSEASDSILIWELLNRKPYTHYQETWPNIKLGDLEILKQNYQVGASFWVSPVHISLITIEGLWKHNITPNKHGVLDRKLALFLYHNRLAGGLGKTLLPGGAISPSETLDRSEALAKLEATIDMIYQAPTDKLPELLSMAELNPQIDLAGGNWLGANLNSMQLSGVNLSQTQLRGADLTDADLSESDLSYARLGGADLSGAYLSNANLQGANLQRASLALANLSGANLQGANLRETNLSNSNLSGAQVVGAVFAENIGLSENQKQQLKKQGATFS